MGTVLMDIQPSIMKYAGVISKVLKVEVEIADSNLVRVAGTGKYKNSINRSMENEGNVYKSALLTGEAKIIQEPGKSSLCSMCPKIQKCDEKFEVCTPIKLGGEVIGVIGLVCFDEAQKMHILEDFDTYMEFLQQISDFISIAAYEKKQMERSEMLLKSLNLIIDRMDRGVLLLNRSNRVTRINKKAVEILNFKDINFKHEVRIEEMSGGHDGLKEYRLFMGDRSYNIMGSIYKMELNEGQYNSMLIFQDAKAQKEERPEPNVNGSSISCEDILGDSEQMTSLKKSIMRIAQSRSTVLITGESGTGKEIFALAIHNEGERRKGPFIAINCGAIPFELLESELFGYVKGAFTGALASGRMGKFELAHKGTIFLDEIGDMPMPLQIKLLRVLQDRKIVRIGSNKPIDVDVRVIAATNKDLLKLINENKFREDLYYRLNVIPINIPPLRERIQDVKVLVEYFIDKYSKLLGRGFTSISIDDDVWQAFYKYPWPGNVRELENVIEFMINMMDEADRFTIDMVPKAILDYKPNGKPVEGAVQRLKDIEKREIQKALKIYGNSTRGKKAAARELGVGIATLYRKIEEHNLSK